MTMPSLIVPFLQGIPCGHPAGQVALQLDALERHPLEGVPWPAYPYKPAVSFAIAHAGACILLKYYVQEEAVRAAHHAVNAPVFEDSCVEFFLSFGEDKGYYNLECNCLGTCSLAYGPQRAGRLPVADGIVRTIRTHTTVDRAAGGNGVAWTLTLVIPAAVFVHHRLLSLQGQRCRANLYKCGDRLPRPHFIAWSGIRSPEPDFHLPQFFGALRFE